MADCIVSQGIGLGCDQGAGGLKKILLTNSTNVASLTPVFGATSDAGIITGITMAAPLGVTASFYEFIPTKQTSSATETSVSNAGGVAGYEQTITMVFAKNEATKRNTVQMMLGADLVAIYQDFNDNWFYFGEWDGLKVDSAVQTTGPTITDLPGWTITLKGFSKYPARQVNSTLALTL